MNNDFYIKPIIKQVGNKSWLKEEIWKFYFRACNDREKNLRFVDPFCGSLAVPFFIIPDQAWVNDANSYIINLYKQLVLEPSMPEQKRDKELYIFKRSQFNNLIEQGVIEGRELAELFYYLNRFGYNGVIRFNQKGKFNTPFGLSKVYKTNFEIEADVLKDWKITNLDFKEVIENCGESDFIFADPPYDEQFNYYVKHSFPWERQVELAHLLSKHPGPVVTTNNPSDRIVDLYTSLGFTRLNKHRFNHLKAAKIQDGLNFKEVLFLRNVE
jgi:DNA adenine methylase